VVHQAFFAERKRLWLFVMGTGNVGKALLRQLAQQRDPLLARGIDLRLCGVSNSRHYTFSADGLGFGAWQRALSKSTRAVDHGTITREIRSADFTNVALVDCTASETVVAAYPDFLDIDAHVVTPNKLANVLPWPRYRRLMDRFASRRKQFLYEANVGAGMPVISTLQDLVASGDVVHRIEGVLSGTLSYLMNSFDGIQPFSELVREAHDQGYTEPDPREDLSGRDVARKLLILSRLLGRKLNLRDVRVENLVPESLRAGRFTPSFYVSFARTDARMRARLEEARSHALVLRYVGTLTSTGAHAGLEAFPMDHPFARVRGTDNMIAITTDRYAKAPLILQGAGAGADVTAMGVFSDILKLANTLA
jgi:aspartokinase/homoserine dehydrogenase 1